MLYDAFKCFHLLGVVLLLGNVTVSAVWKVFADRTNDGRIVAFAQGMITVTDIGLTAAGITLIIAGGYGAVVTAGMNPISTPWLLYGQALFLISGAIWIVVLVPLQIKLARLSRVFRTTGDISASYRRLSAHWLFWGIIATIPLIAATWVMTAKR